MESTAEWRYQNDEYEMRRSSSGWVGSTAPIIVNPNNYFIEADARLYAGSIANGLIFDWQDWDNFKIFSVYPGHGFQGYYKVSKRVNGSWITAIEWVKTPTVNPSLLTNRLKVRRNGNNITLYVNDNVVTTMTDDTKGYRVGLFMEQGKNNLGVARFDNFKSQEQDITSVTDLMQTETIQDQVYGGIDFISAPPNEE